MPRTLDFLVPGPLRQRTGGYLYDARMVDGLRRLGWDVRVHNLPGTFPDGDDHARDALAGALSSLPAGARVVLDGLSMGGIPDPLRMHAGRLGMLALVHHPLADESGLDAATRARLRTSERDALAQCKGVIVTSAFTAVRLTTYAVPAARIRTVLPGTDPAPLAEGPGPGEPPVLLCVGTVIPRKGHDVLIDALARISALPWTCVCAGSLDRDPNHARTVIGRAARANLAERVRFVGELDSDQLDALYHRSSLFVLPSRYEGYGMAFAEALMRGLPVIGTTGGAIPGTVPAEAGVLVEPGDDEALAEVLRALLDGEDASPSRFPTLTELRLGARTAAARLPSWDESVTAFARCVDELLSEPA